MNDEELESLIFARFYDIPAKQRQVIVKNIQAWHTRKLKEAVREEWALISEVAHSANITAELFISKAREERLAELEEQPDER